MVKNKGRLSQQTNKMDNYAVSRRPGGPEAMGGDGVQGWGTEQDPPHESSLSEIMAVIHDLKGSLEPRLDVVDVERGTDSAGPTIEDPAQQYLGGTIKSGVRDLDVVRPSSIQGGVFKPTSGRFEEERPSAATAPAEETQREAEQWRTVAVTVAASETAYEAATRRRRQDQEEPEDGGPNLVPASRWGTGGSRASRQATLSGERDPASAFRDTIRKEKKKENEDSMNPQRRTRIIKEAHNKDRKNKTINC
ncbi:hypothetical protein NDU88_004792 [Pleurodeles waltl]|uniref:Uncharacterized protein n=1 Tax=Pleurodeles waltl TaxID=8319 RepID=A0AAV7SJT4_PLEWA|nr:hypothetical protein NDU88_004792 [Pleurodeles waltl]